MIRNARDGLDFMDDSVAKPVLFLAAWCGVMGNVCPGDVQRLRRTRVAFLNGHEAFDKTAHSALFFFIRTTAERLVRT